MTKAPERIKVIVDPEGAMRGGAPHDEPITHTTRDELVVYVREDIADKTLQQTCETVQDAIGYDPEWLKHRRRDLYERVAIKMIGHVTLFDPDKVKTVTEQILINAEKFGEGG